ncbi:MAG: hypothetical protein HGA80_04075 [Candidatus Omnitrophica bacterium]|nr:hypothetical protein [Candidatus Omnitrophota bacterium]
MYTYFRLLFCLLVLQLCVIDHPLLAAAVTSNSLVSDDNGSDDVLDAIRRDRENLIVEQGVPAGERQKAHYITRQTNDATHDPNDAKRWPNDATIRPNDATVHPNNAILHPNDATRHPNDADDSPNQDAMRAP